MSSITFLGSMLCMYIMDGKYMPKYKCGYAVACIYKIHREHLLNTVEALQQLLYSNNSPDSHKLKYLRNINEPQLTKIAQHLVTIWKL